MNFPWSDPNNLLNFILSLSFLVIILGAVTFAMYRCVRRKAPLIIYCVVVCLVILFYLLNLMAPFAISLSALCIIVTLSLFGNLGDLRKFIANPFKVTQAKPDTNNVERIYDSAAVNAEITKAVMHLSKNKIGAIMTFERSNSLSDIMKNGVMVKAPVTAELLITIFYPGTRLHDGAVIIHGNQIMAANVFFTPTTKPYAGKYGSRHRAAIGISEISDALTVVVSEETGRISFAVNGSLEIVDQANFSRVFENLLDDKAK